MLGSLSISTNEYVWFVWNFSTNVGATSVIYFDSSIVHSFGVKIIYTNEPRYINLVPFLRQEHVLLSPSRTKRPAAQLASWSLSSICWSELHESETVRHTGIEFSGRVEGTENCLHKILENLKKENQILFFWGKLRRWN